MPINDSKYWNEALETISRQDLEKQQLIDLKKIVKYAYENSPYYKRAFDKAGVKPEDIVTLKDIEKFPFMDKKTQRDTQGKGSFLGELCAVPENDVVFISTSSGSTGVPTISPFTQKDFDEFQETEARWFWQVGVRPNDRYVHALNFSQLRYSWVRDRNRIGIIPEINKRKANLIRSTLVQGTVIDSIFLTINSKVEFLLL